MLSHTLQYINGSLKGPIFFPLHMQPLHSPIPQARDLPAPSCCNVHTIISIHSTLPYLHDVYSKFHQNVSTRLYGVTSQMNICELPQCFLTFSICLSHPHARTCRHTQWSPSLCNLVLLVKGKKKKKTHKLSIQYTKFTHKGCVILQCIQKPYLANCSTYS
jgi:hypothetical protein